MSKNYLTMDQLNTDSETVAKMHNLQMKCPFFDLGCVWNGKFRNFAGHLRDCKFVYGSFTSRFADFPTSGGGLVKWDLTDRKSVV